MWRSWISAVVFVAACGKGDDARAPAGGSAAPARAEATERAAPASLLDDAAAQITGQPSPAPRDLVALARAQAAWKRPDAAKQTLAQALAAARADNTRDGTIALVLAVDVLHALDDAAAAAALRDEALGRLRADAQPGEALAQLFGPLAAVESSETLRQLATFTVTRVADADRVTRGVRPGTPAWDGLEAAVRALEIEHRAVALVRLAERARQLGRTDVAKALIADPDASHTEDVAAYAHELIFAGDARGAQRAIGRPLSRTPDDGPLERAEMFASTALVHAHAADAKSSKADDAKAVAALQAAGDDVDDDVVSAVYVDLAAARLARGDTDAGFAIVRERLDGEAPGEVAYVLAEIGKRDVAIRVLEGMKRGDDQRDAIADIVELDAEHGKLDAAVELAFKGGHGSPPGIDAILRAYAYAGDVAAVDKLAAKDRDAFAKLELDAFHHVAAVTLAQRRDCAGATAAAAKLRVRRGACLATVARYCTP